MELTGHLRSVSLNSSLPRPQTEMSVTLEIRSGLTDLVAIQAEYPSQFPYLLESVSHGNVQARFSILLALPGDHIESTEIKNTGTFLTLLENEFQSQKITDNHQSDSDLPFRGGWFIYLGYETACEIEPVLDLPGFSYNYPTAFATRCHAAIILDHLKSETICLAETMHRSYLTEMLDILDTRGPDGISPNFGEIHEEESQKYIDGVERILDYIRAGDVFQVNLSRSWRTRLSHEVDSIALYEQLRYSNPAPFSCHVHHKQGDIISSSPERLVSIRKGFVETRPIAGTRPRTHDEKDRQWIRELETDHKERAEHIMLIDLERNDLGKICEPGSIVANEMMTLESYEHVHHIVSNIRGKMCSDASPVDAIKAVFPGGTITGCPKVRCMAIIAELEQEGRGPYTGSAGYLNRDGSVDLNILIRTIFKCGKEVYFRSGAGIVADSDPRRELEETRQKARGLLLALGQSRHDIN